MSVRLGYLNTGKEFKTLSPTNDPTLRLLNDRAVSKLMLNVLQAEQRRCRRPKRLHLRRRWVRRQQPAMSQQCGSLRPGQGCLDKNNGHVGKEVWSW